KNFRLRITAGPTYDKSLQRIVTVNSPDPHPISDNVAISLRIRDYTGLPSASPASVPEYFDLPQHSKDTFSVAFAFTPPKDIPASNLYFGIDTGHNPVRKFGIPKSLINTAFKIVKEFIDPSLSCDAGVDEPWVRGPVVAGATTTLCGSVSPEAQAHRKANSLPSDAGKRRKHLNSERNREKFVLQQGRRYYFDFSNGYIDWKAYALKLPGFSVPVLKYLGNGAGEGGAKGGGGSHKVRFFLKDLVTEEVYFVIMCTLLTGEDLRLALEEDGNG
ncbi:hypothetical protein BDZ85DRAFT_182960, partial [Elsinoe ampelina]